MSDMRGASHESNVLACVSVCGEDGTGRLPPRRVSRDWMDRAFLRKVRLDDATLEIGARRADDDGRLAAKRRNDGFNLMVMGPFEAIEIKIGKNNYVIE